MFAAFPGGHHWRRCNGLLAQIFEDIRKVEVCGSTFNGMAFVSHGFACSSAQLALNPTVRVFKRESVVCRDCPDKHFIFLLSTTPVQRI